MAKKPAVAKKAPAEVQEKSWIDGDKAFAAHYGISTRTVQTWRDKGLPHERVPPNSYRYNLDKTDEWVDLFRGTDDPEGSSEQLRELGLAKLRIELAKATRLEREEEEATGNILPKDEFESFCVETIQVVRGQFLQIPKQSRRHMCSKCQKTVPIELERLITKALNHLARMREGPKDL